MGKVASRFTRPLKNWNIENRAHKVISKDKPIPAPMYESTKRQIELVNKLEPDYKKKAATKDPQLDDFLKQVYVRSNSTEVQEIDSRKNTDRPLPKERFLHEGFELGFHIPDETIPGKINLKQALELLGKYSKDPEKYNAESLAVEYKMEPKLVADILEYYKIFHIFEKETAGNSEAIARVVPISLKSGMTIKHTIKKRKIKKPKDEEKEERRGEEIEKKLYSYQRKIGQIKDK